MLFQVRELTPKEAENTYPDLWAVVNKMFPNVERRDRARIVGLVVDTCPHCYSDNKSCLCHRDD